MIRAAEQRSRRKVAARCRAFGVRFTGDAGRGRCGRSLPVGQALDTVEAHGRAGHAGTALSASPVAVATRLIIQQCRSSKWQRAIQYLSEVSEMVTPDVVCFTAVVGICSRASSWQHGLSLMQDMRKVDVAPNLITYNSLVAAAARSAEWTLAVALLEEMEIIELQPDQVTYNTTMVALRKAGLSRQALHFSASRVTAADPYTYCALISACKKTAKWAKALNLVDDAMRRFSHLNKYVLSAGIASCARGWQPSHALRLLELSVAYGGPDVVSRDATVSACAASALWQEALRLIEPRHGRTGVQSLLNAAFAASSFAPVPMASKALLVAQRRAVKELRRMPTSDGAWHDAILAESLANYARSPCEDGGKFAQDRERLLRMLRAYVLAPVSSQLKGGLAFGEKIGQPVNCKLLQQQYGFGGLCKDLSLHLGMEYPDGRLPSEWMGPEVLKAWRRPTRNHGILLPREPVAQELFVCLDYAISFSGEGFAEHFHVSYAGGLQT